LGSSPQSNTCKSSPLERFESLLHEAEVDYRDVLVSAEYDAPTSPLVARLSDEYLSWFDRLRVPDEGKGEPSG